MKFFLVDVKSITSAKSREQFDRAELENLADSILECEGLLKPLVLKPTGPETYAVLEGDREYYAAVRAREKNPRKGEMVNAFVVPPKVEEMIVRQIYTLKNQEAGSSPVSVMKSAEEASAKTPDSLQFIQKELENVSRKIEGLVLLPSQLTEIIQKLERNFQDKIESVKSEFRQLEAKLFSELLTKKADREDYSAKTVPELKLLAKERKIKGYSRMKKPQLITALENLKEK